LYVYNLYIFNLSIATDILLIFIVTSEKALAAKYLFVSSSRCDKSLSPLDAIVLTPVTINQNQMLE